MARADATPQNIPAERLEALRIRLLGGFSVSIGTRTIEQNEWRLKRASSLVKLLALAPSHRLHREQVMDALWPDSGKKAAANSLREALHAARRTLDSVAGSHYLASEDKALVLHPKERLWVDVEAFEEASETARHTRDLAAYRAALDLYAGDLLPVDRYEEWAQQRREELRQLHLVLLVELATLYEERGENGPAVDLLKRAIAREPTLEEAHAGLMRLYALSDRKAQALIQYDRLEEILSGQLGAEPSSATRRLRAQIVTGEFPVPRTLPAGPPREVPPDARNHNLPTPRTSFVGREREMVEIKRELAMTRLLTLTGAGGSGKTRLALEVSRNLVGAYPDGVWLVELAPLSEGTLVSQAVAEVLGVSEWPGQPLIDTLAATLRHKTLLLILDNCEHLVEGAARLVTLLLDTCPRLKILATSREALRVMGEVVWPVPLLSVPDLQLSPTVEELESYESVRLFAGRAHERNPTFAVNLDNAHVVAEICRRLDGLPLAIELAAARTKVLPPEAMLARLGSRLKLLGGAARDLPQRQKSLRATIEWSYELLDDTEKTLFARLSVFCGGCTLEAVEAVCDAEGDLSFDVLEGVSSLLDKSLISQEEGARGERRFVMLETIHEYARERLDLSEEAEKVSRRHLEYFLALAEEAELQLRGARQGKWLERLELEHDNLRGALSWALEGGEAELGLRLSGTLGEFWHMHAHLSEGRRWLDAALAQRDAPDSARAKALSRAGYIAWEQGDYQRSVALSEESLVLSRRLGDKASAATALYTLGWAALFSNELERASTLTEEAVTLQRETNDTVGVVRTHLIVGLVAVGQHDHERAIVLHEETLALARKVGDGFAIVLSLGLGQIASLGLGDHQRVRALLKEGLELSQRLKMMHLTAANLHLSASLAGAQAQPVRAARLWGAAESLCGAIGTLLSPWERHVYGPYIDTARAQLDESVWEVAWAEGKAMTFEEAIEYALLEESSPNPVSPASKQLSAGAQPPNLTRREREVASLLAEGLTNRQIASELVISERTVDNHVSNIFKKLGLTSREQVAARLN
jgi:predicted ATPase/DNA-binding SARP family transcriptional activator/DNA-binding CsgD family transcriptional regulator